MMPDFLIFPMLFFIIGMHVYQYKKINEVMTKIRLRQKNTINEIVELKETILNLRAMLDEQQGALKTIKISQKSTQTISDPIEHGYERAKILLKKGISNQDLLKTGLTEEEYQLIYDEA